MASHSVEGNTEVFTLEMELAEFVNNCDLPANVVITDGSFLTESVQLSKGNVLIVNSCDRSKVTLSYKSSRSERRKQVRVSKESKMHFNVLPSKDSVEPEDHSNSRPRTSSTVIYPTISDLLIDCPTFFEATASYDDPYLPGLSIHAGDQFRFVGTQPGRGGGLDLQVKDELDNILILTAGCRGDFRPLVDTRPYTLQELIDLAPVPRRLKLFDPEMSSSKGYKFEDTPYPQSKRLETSVDEYSTVTKPERDNVVSPGSKTESYSEDTKYLPDHDLCDFESVHFSGVIHLLKPDPLVLVSPYGDHETTWEIPLSANIKVKPYSPSDYEVPQRPSKQSPFQNVMLPEPPMSPVMPQFPAPSVPPLKQPLVPLSVSSFADIYSDSMPAKASVMDMHDCDSFWTEALEGVNDVFVYRTDEENRLFVKDPKSDDVFNLSGDLDISFVEYPEKFSTVSELLTLPIGTEIAVLEDIASDYPKPFSLRFGDIIRTCSNSSQFLKLKYGNRDCEILKVEKIDPSGDNPIKLKLPMDFEVQMTMSTGSSSPKTIHLKDLLSGSTEIPSRVVASLPGEPGKHKDVLDALPVDVQILRSMKQTVIVVAPNCRRHSNNTGSSEGISGRLKEESLSNIGLSASCGVVLAFRGRLEISEMDLAEYNADFRRIPIEKLSLSEYEERVHQRKLTADYEDIGLRGSDASLDDCGASNLRRSHSAGGLEQREKRRNIDKVRRLSRALNPKHWRNTRQEPEPLPPPTAMGLLALAARPPAAHSNDYVDRQDEEQEQLVKKTSSTHSGSTNTGGESDGEEDENLYEDVEIGPIKSSTLASSSAPRRGPFSGIFHQSMPGNRRSPKLPFRGPRNKNPELDRSGDNLDMDEAAGGKYIADGATSAGGGKEGNPAYDVPKQHKGKALRWATKLGDKIQARYDVPKLWGSKGKEEVKSGAKEEENSNFLQRENFDTTTPSSSSPPTMRAPSPPLEPPPRTTSLAASASRNAEPDNVKEVQDGPVAPARRKRGARASKAVSDMEIEKVAEQSCTDNMIQEVKSSVAAGRKQVDNNEVARVQPRPRSSLLRTEHQPGEESQPAMIPPRPKPRGLKSLSSDDPIIGDNGVNIGNVINSMESMECGETKDEGFVSRPAKVPPKVKPRTTS